MFQVLQHDSRSLIWWFEQHCREKIDLDPSYQRRTSLWIPRKQAGLIDSIINDYDIPKFYVADFTYANTKLNEQQKSYAVIDGKQRFQALFAFFEGKLPLNPDFRFEEESSIEIGGLTYIDLKRNFPRIALKVENFVPTVMSVVASQEGKIKELFIRLNTGIPVNGAEKRNAMPGVVPELIRRLAGHKFFKKKIRFNVTRMQDFNVVAKLLLVEHRGRFVDTKASNLDRFVKDGQNIGDESFERAARKVSRILNALCNVFDDEDPLLESTGQIPIYYWIVREHPESVDNNLRARLSDFAGKVKENQDIIKEDPDNGDPTLSKYYTMSRTTNDQASLLGRYKILITRI